MKKLLCVILCVCFSLCAVSCTQKKATAEEILGGIMSELKDLPKGKIYHSGAVEGSEEFLSADIAESLYGKTAKSKLSLVKDFAIYVSSFASPCEIGVFICYSSSDALKIERMCRERADVLLVALRESDLCSLDLNAALVRKGRKVVFAMTDGSSRTEKIIKRFI